MELKRDRNRLLELLKRHSLLFGGFTLVSGKKSNSEVFGEAGGGS